MDSLLLSVRTNAAQIFAGIGLMFFSQAIFAQTISVSPSPSYNGSYIVTATGVGCSNSSIYVPPWGSMPLTECTSVREYEGSTQTDFHFSATKSYSGKPAGTYVYSLVYVISCAICGDQTTTMASVDVEVLPLPSAPGIPTSVSNTSYSGSYSISWNAASNATYYQLQENLNGGSWNTVYNSSGISVSRSGRTPGLWAYRVNACHPGGCSSWSGTKTVSVSAPATAYMHETIGYITTLNSRVVFLKATKV